MLRVRSCSPRPSGHGLSDSSWFERRRVFPSFRLSFDDDRSGGWFCNVNFRLLGESTDDDKQNRSLARFDVFLRALGMVRQLVVVASDANAEGSAARNAAYDYY